MFKQFHGCERNRMVNTISAQDELRKRSIFCLSWFYVRPGGIYQCRGRMQQPRSPRTALDPLQHQVHFLN